MRMKVQFKALRALTFFLGVVFGSKDAFASAQYQDFQNQVFPSLVKVPYHIKCNLGTLDNAVSYPTRCILEPNGPGSSQLVNPLAAFFGAHNSDAELPQSPDFPKAPSMTFFTREPIPSYFSGKPPEDQKIQTTFSFRQADMNQEGPLLLPSEFLPFQRTKQSRRRNDESEYFSPANRNQNFLNKNFLSEVPVKSDFPSRRPKPMHSVMINRDPKQVPLYKQYTNIRPNILREYDLTKSQLYPSLHSFTAPSSETPESSFPRELVDGNPSSLSFSEEQEDPFFSQDPLSPSLSLEQDDPFFSQDPSFPYFSEEQEDPFFSQDLSFPSFSEEQEDSSSPSFSEEQVPSSFLRRPSSPSEEQEVPSYPQYPLWPSYSEEQEVASFPQDPSSPYFSEEQEDPWSPSSSEEQVPSSFLRRPSSPYISEEQEGPFYPQHALSPSYSEEQEVPSYPQYPSSSFHPQEQGASFFSHYPRYRYYPQSEESPAVSFFVADEIPLTKPLPLSQEHDSLAEILELLQQQRVNERPSWYNEEPNDRKLSWGNSHKDNEEVWSPPVHKKRNSLLSKIQRKFKRIFHFPQKIQTRKD